jgi:hypothetical protein
MNYSAEATMKSGELVAMGNRLAREEGIALPRKWWWRGQENTGTARTAALEQVERLEKMLVEARAELAEASTGQRQEA